MLISFTVENFKSIRDLQTLSLDARSDTHLEESHVIADGTTRLLKSVALFGPNASGTSNLATAFVWFRRFVSNSSKEGQAGQPIDIDPFRLSTTTENAPTHFEVEFLWNGYFYRYGFEVTRTAVESEWLYRRAKGASKTAMLFKRSGQDFDVSATLFKEGKGLNERTRANALFLSVCAQWNGPVATEVMQWMNRLRILSGLSESGFIALAGPISHTLEEGSILVVDELEARLHPLLTQAIVALFHSPANRHNAQLIFTTQDVLLMEPTLLRRDQIWFCEKDDQGATDLYTLADFDPNQVRPTSKFSRQYLLGIFGAVPKLAHFEEAAADVAKE